MEGIDTLEASLTVTEAGVVDPAAPFFVFNGDGERKRGGRGGGGALKSISNIALGGGGSGPALEWIPGW
jgi:hypothetical protein